MQKKRDKVGQPQPKSGHSSGQQEQASTSGKTQQGASNQSGGQKPSSKQDQRR